MTDRELLKLAAKAVNAGNASWNNVDYQRGFLERWNPLTDDGDALRLAVILSLNIFHTGGCAYALESDCDDSNEQQVSYCDAGDMFAATRRAIVRAAAEIGKDMP